MKAEETRVLWLFVFFDLPVGTKAERNTATRFRNFLKDDGYMMLQFSVYARVARGEDAASEADRVPRRGVAAGWSVRRFRAGAGSIRWPRRATR